MDLSVRRHPDASSFLERAEAWLLEREPEHTLLLGIAARLRERPRSEIGGDEGREPFYLATIEERGAVVGCAFRTPPHKVGLTRMPAEAVPLLVEDIAGVYEAVPAVVGPDGLAEAFGQRWAEVTGVEAVAGSRQRIHVLAEVERVDPPPGGARPAAPEDRDLLVEWWRAFEAEAGVLPGNAEAAVDRGLGEGRLVVWEDGAPRSLAGVAARTANGARVGPVYTPPQQRGRGYATALVADLTRRLLEGGCSFCCLYTDLSNATSNAIYRRIGYRPLLDVRDVAFRAREADAR